MRIGNAAAEQLQLDVCGEVIDCAAARPGGRPVRQRRTPGALQLSLLEFLEGNWREPDNGLWEMRGPRRHFVHSKVMAWVAADRWCAPWRRLRLDGAVDRWRAMRDADAPARCARRGTTRSGTRSPSRTAPRSWTRRCC